MGRKHYQQIMSAAEKRNPSNQIIDRNFEQYTLNISKHTRTCSIADYHSHFFYEGSQLFYFNKGIVQIKVHLVDN